MSSEEFNMINDINRKAHADSLRAVGTDLKQIDDDNKNINKIASGVAEMAFSQALIVEGDLATKADIPIQPCRWHNELKKRFDDYMDRRQKWRDFIQQNIGRCLIIFAMGYVVYPAIEAFIEMVKAFYGN